MDVLVSWMNSEKCVRKDMSGYVPASIATTLGVGSGWRLILSVIHPVEINNGITRR